MNAVEVEDVSKYFRITHGKEDSLKGIFTKLFKEKKYVTEEFWALKNVSFNIKKGEVFGIIGSNGSGKTTLLKILAKIIYSDSGRVRVNGKVSTLFELGTGFHPELTGRENIYLNGSILGLSKKDIDAAFDEIVDFSGLENFIDTPLKSYSAGMQVRLAFSVAVNVDPEILLVDEVLAVGDVAFQQKSFSKFQEFKKKGITIVFVSHDLASIQTFTDRALLIDKGQARFVGKSEKAVVEYLKTALRGSKEANKDKRKDTDKKLDINVKFFSGNQKENQVFMTGEKLVVRILYSCKERIEDPVFGIEFKREDGFYLSGPNNKTSGYPIPFIEGKGYIDFEIESIPLLSGNYYAGIHVVDSTTPFHYDFSNEAAPFQIAPNEANQAGILKFKGSWRLGKKL